MVASALHADADTPGGLVDRGLAARQTLEGLRDRRDVLGGANVRLDDVLARAALRSAGVPVATTRPWSMITMRDAR